MLSVEGKMLHLEERLRMGGEIMKTYIYEGGFGIVAGCQLAHRRFTMPFGDKEPSWNPFAVYD